MIEISDKKDCCGCSACVGSCPKKCIVLKEDSEGFLYPEVDRESCVECGLCERSCPVLNSKFLTNDIKPEAYAAYVKDEVLRANSSSGGIFSVLAESVLQMGGVVFGAAFDHDFSVKHIAVETSAELERLRGSKYVQSRIENTYEEAKDFLDCGRIVLYTGTACQIAGLKAYLKKTYENLYTLDVLCHGVPSPKLWKKYVAEQEKTHGGTVRQTFFRHKEYGWKMYAVSLEFSNETAYRKKHPEDIFMRLFLANICLRPSCHACKFKGLLRPSDITLGDCWGIEKTMPEMDDDRGTSVVLIHSQKGKALLDSVGEHLVRKKGEADVLLPPTADSRKSVSAHRRRKKFFKELDRDEWNIERAEKILRPGFRTRIRNGLRRFIGG